ncbi:uncharacterized protein DDB_G0286379-like [Chrysoperla carnea]|uniref:uncharacterized protein DDB_G0286379-like n=1 Tax=Chrysoperla carnea TaxID=189513 RepID=UPI001D06DEC0|nr:uncharacterized protein DDB_G0286379-like [Chrysoperla carnea]
MASNQDSVESVDIDNTKQVRRASNQSSVESVDIANRKHVRRGPRCNNNNNNKRNRTCGCSSRIRKPSTDHYNYRSSSKLKSNRIHNHLKSKRSSDHNCYNNNTNTNEESTKGLIYDSKNGLIFYCKNEKLGKDKLKEWLLDELDKIKKFKCFEDLV